ncbi:hypothetical protein B0H17DRAFT_1095725, partial [Mycena rosella]
TRSARGAARRRLRLRRRRAPIPRRPRRRGRRTPRASRRAAGTHSRWCTPSGTSGTPAAREAQPRHRAPGIPPIPGGLRAAAKPGGAGDCTGCTYMH